MRPGPTRSSPQRRWGRAGLNGSRWEDDRSGSSGQQRCLRVSKITQKYPNSNFLCRTASLTLQYSSPLCLAAQPEEMKGVGKKEGDGVVRAPSAGSCWRRRQTRRRAANGVTDRRAARRGSSFPKISACNMLIFMFDTLFLNAGCSREASHPASTEHQGKIYSLFP